MFAEFMILSQKLKILNSKHLSKQYIQFKSPQKFYLKTSSTAKFFTLKIFRLYDMTYKIKACLTTFRISKQLNTKSNCVGSYR